MAGGWHTLKLSLAQWADFFLENYSKPPVRAAKTHQVNLRVAKHLKGAFASRKLVDITADDIEMYLRDRLRKVVRIRTALGFRQMGVLKPTTVHQELRVLRRMLNVAVRKKLLQSNPCWGVEFPVAVRGYFGLTTVHGQNSAASNRMLQHILGISFRSLRRRDSESTRN